MLTRADNDRYHPDLDDHETADEEPSMRELAREALIGAGFRFVGGERARLKQTGDFALVQYEQDGVTVHRAVFYGDGKRRWEWLPSAERAVAALAAAGLAAQAEDGLEIEYTWPGEPLGSAARLAALRARRAA